MNVRLTPDIIKKKGFITVTKKENNNVVVKLNKLDNVYSLLSFQTVPVLQIFTSLLTSMTVIQETGQ